MNADSKPARSRSGFFSARLERRLRLGSGLVLAFFVSLHLANHALGLISIELMESARAVHMFIWQNSLGQFLLIAAFIVHFMLALRSLHRRSTLIMPLWEAAQLAFGLAIPLMLVGHVVGAQVAPAIIGFDISYPYVIGAIWSDEWLRIKQPLLLVLVWVHAVIGLHFWLRLQVWYRRLLPLLFALVVVLPVLATLGFVRAGLDMQETLSYPAAYADIYSGPLNAAPEQQALIKKIADWAPRVIMFFLVATLIARWFRLWLAYRQPRFIIHHPEVGKVQGLIGQSLLEVLRAAKVPHASICGGRARCTTCRINIDRGQESLAPPSPLEASALKRIKAGDSVRLACQIQPQADIWITPLLPPRLGTADYQGEGGISGNEQQVVAMFVDLRGFSSFAESRLPYDVVLILNQFFAHMSAALDSTRGHYAQFTGDGLFALFGLQGHIRQACRDAILSAVEMQRRLESLNLHVRDELQGALKIGIGIHCGVAIVGPMGPPKSRVISAIGDSVNIASRLESATKQFGCIAVISRDTLQRAELSLPDIAPQEIEIRGRKQKLAVYPIHEIETLKALFKDMA